MSMQTGVLHRGLFPYLLLSMAALCHVQDAFRHSRGDESGQQQRMRNYLQFAQQLQDVAPIWRAGPGSTLRQVRHILCCMCQILLPWQSKVCYSFAHSAALAGRPGKAGLDMMQVVLSELSAQVVQWLLKDAPPVVHHQPQNVTLIGFETSSSMLNIQLAANWLAQRAG